MFLLKCCMRWVKRDYIPVAMIYMAQTENMSGIFRVIFLAPTPRFFCFLISSFDSDRKLPIPKQFTSTRIVFPKIVRKLCQHISHFIGS